MTHRRAAFVTACLASATLLPLGPGCGGKVGVVTPGDDAGSSSGVVSSSSGTGSSGGTSASSGSTSSGGIGSSTGSGSGGSSTGSGSGGSSTGSGSGSTGGSSSSSSGAPLDGGPASCANPASSVPGSELPPFVPVMQDIGACSATDIAGFITACDSASGTATACNNWYAAAPPSCLSCLGVTDAGPPSPSGALWYDWQGNFIGANAPGCDALVDGNTGCASPYDSAVQCLLAAGCETCTTQTEFTTCQQVVFGTGGACSSYLPPAQMACNMDFTADGGALNNGPCSTDTQILSVICGNGSGDGG